MGKVITIDELQEGAILDEDVMNTQGLTLLKQGVAIEERHIKILRRWGVEKVAIADAVVAGEDGLPPEELFNETVQNITAEMDECFQDCMNNDMMVTVKNCVFEYRIAQAKKKIMGE